MHEKSPAQTHIGGTKPAPNARKITTGVQATHSGHKQSSGGHGGSTDYEQVVGGPEAQLRQAERLRSSRGKQPVVLVTAFILIAAVAVGAYLMFVG